MPRSFSSPSNWITKNPIIAFVILTFLIAYLIGIPFNMFVSSFLEDANEVIFGLLPRLMTVYAPALSAILVTYIVSGSLGSKALFRKLMPQKKHFFWWITIPIICTLITFISFSLGGIPVTQITAFCKHNLPLLLLHFFGQFIIVGVGEELGWRGWLLPRFIKQTSVGVAALIVTAIWGLWHLPILFSGIQIVIPWIMILFSAGIILTWIWYKVDGNVFVMALAHASMNAPEVFLENRLTNVGASNDLCLAGWQILGYAYLLLACIVIIFNHRLWRKNANELPGISI